MSHQNHSSETTFSYLSALHTPEHGYFGGYLILSALGRPLEFHCTSPVRPSRAQEILYGPTLHPFLIGDQIAGSLLVAAKMKPQVILTDQAAMLTCRLRASTPMALVLVHAEYLPSVAIVGESVADSPASSGRESDELWLPFGQFKTSCYTLQLPPGFESEQKLIVESIALLTQQVDLAEPFGRIHDAIREAQRIGGRTTEAHGQAA